MQEPRRIKAVATAMILTLAFLSRRERAGARVTGAARPLSMMPAPNFKDDQHV